MNLSVHKHIHRRETILNEFTVTVEVFVKFYANGLNYLAVYEYYFKDLC